MTPPKYTFLPWIACPLLALGLYAGVYFCLVQRVEIIDFTYLSGGSFGDPTINVPPPPPSIVIAPGYASNPHVDKMLGNVFGPIHYIDRKLRPSNWKQ